MPVLLNLVHPWNFNSFGKMKCAMSLAEWSIVVKCGWVHHAIIGDPESWDEAGGDGGGGAGSCGGREEVVSLV